MMNNDMLKPAAAMAVVTADNVAEATVAKKIPCWTCGGDLLLNYATVAASGVIIRTYCARCRKAGAVSMMTDK
jgi:hypothetical protein